MTRQKAIIVCGPPGAGKTTYGRALAAETKSLLLDIDTATEAIVRAALSAANKDPDDRDSLWFKENFRGPIYDTLFRICLLYTSPSPRDQRGSRMPSSA